MKVIIAYCTLIFLTGCGRHYTTHRSPLRKPTYQVPTIVVSDNVTPYTYARTSGHYKKHPIFTIFNHQSLIDNQVPANGITDSQDNVMVSKDMINSMLNDIVSALKENKNLLPHCTIIRDTNFNYSTLCGLIMLKLNDYPLIIKLFRETPESFVSPFSKGFEPTTFFFMSGGSNRHIAGLTRIPNRLHLLSLIEADQQWKDIVKIPRKWYWTPDPMEWLHIDGYNMASEHHIHTEIPSTYAVIADYITVTQTTTLDIDAQKKLIMDLCTICSSRLDPHMKNFILNGQPNSDLPLITIIDTEDHSCMTGLTEPITYTNHIEWYTVLTGKFLKNLLFNVKQEYS